MLHDAMLAYDRASGDAPMARLVASRDDRVDALQSELIDAISALIRDDPRQTAPGVPLSWVAHR